MKEFILFLFAAILHMYFARFLSHFFYDEGMTPQPEPFTLQLALGTVHSDCYKVTETGKYLHRNKIKKQGEVITGYSWLGMDLGIILLR